jgi:uncharacterized protein HemY
MNKLLITILVIVVILVVVLYYYLKRQINNMCEKDKIIKTLVRQASRWATAAKQDNNALIAVLHANYGAGYLWALKDVFTDKDIEEVMNFNILKFRDEIIKIQDDANLKLIKECPSFANQSDYLVKLAKEG